MHAILMAPHTVCLLEHCGGNFGTQFSGHLYSRLVGNVTQ
jgi:hypothetical protein